MTLETSRPATPTRRRRLQRNARRRRIGGVCAGLADYLGWDVNFIRFFFLLSMFFGGLGIGVYLALWMALPLAAMTPIPRVSWPLQRELRRIEKKVLRLNRSHDPMIADLAQEAFDAIKILAPQFDPAKQTAVNEDLQIQALAGFPTLLDRLQAIPHRQFSQAHLQSAHSAAALLMVELEDYRQRFQQATYAAMEQEFMRSMGADDMASPELAAWRRKLRPLQEKLGERSTEETSRLLASIEDTLGFLLFRLDEGSGELMDLRPFEVRKIAFEYLPDTLNEFLRLPPSLAKTEALHGENTAEETLNEQLTLLDTTLHDLAKSLFEKDATSLLVNGRFLKEKFAEPLFRTQSDAKQERPS
jgi:phage shock protein PspC (stress-responsive transcriptional regulator)